MGKWRERDGGLERVSFLIFNFLVKGIRFPVPVQ
jgi:hypothetical protein